MEVLDKILGAFFFGDLQSLATLLKRLDEHRITHEQLYDYVKRKKKRLLEDALNEAKMFESDEKELKDKSKRCPYCHKVMILADAGNNDSHWWCKDCSFGIYSHRNVVEELKHIGIKDERV